MIDTGKTRRIVLSYGDAVLSLCDEIDRLRQEIIYNREASKACEIAAGDTIAALRDWATRLENLYRRERGANKQDWDMLSGVYDAETARSLEAAGIS